MSGPPTTARPWFPVPWHDNIPAVYALKALEVGEATPDQQKLALDYIIYVVSKRYELPWFPDSERESSFAAGKLFVGDQILKLLALKADDIQARIDQRKK